MKKLTRRDFLKTAGAYTAWSTLPFTLTACGKGEEKPKATPAVPAPKAAAPAKPAAPRVIVVGGGFGGATCAKYIRRYATDIDVTLVERVQKFSTCPFSNVVIGGGRNMENITQSYDALAQKHGVNVVHDEVTAVDPVKAVVTLKSGKTLEYDRLVLSPGIDFRWDAIEGYDEATSMDIPHAWQAGEQTVILRKQLEAMDDGGLVILAPPGNPFRCPPGPYERASMIANYLKQHKPKSKILILDAKDKFSKQPLFMQGWEQLYPGMIEWVKGSEGGKIQGVDAATRTVNTELGDKHQGAVINIIPPQKGGALVHTVGLTNNDGWCPVNQQTFESSVHKNIHVIGDSCIAGKMPKSGFAANSQAKVCAGAVVAAIKGLTLPEPSYVNTCYSLVAPDYGISVAAVYRHTDAGIVAVEGAGGVSPKDADAAFRKKEADYARGWYDSITSDAWG